jgi:hypothetical protein
MVEGIQRTYDGGWDPSAQSGGSKSEQVKHCMGLVHYRHCLYCLHLEPTHLVHPSGTVGVVLRVRVMLGVRVCTHTIRIVRTHTAWWVGSNGHMMVDGIQVHTVEAVSQSKSSTVWI